MIITSKNGFSIEETDGPNVILKNKDGIAFVIPAWDLAELSVQLPSLGYGHTCKLVCDSVEEKLYKPINEEFRKELRDLINRHSIENGSNTPDFILAEYLENCLKAFDIATNARSKWYGGDEVEEEPIDDLNYQE